MASIISQPDLMDQALVSTPTGVFAVDVQTGNISSHFQDSAASVVVPVGTGETRVICAPQSSKGLLHYWKLTPEGTPEGSGMPVYKCSSPEKFSALVFSSCGGLMFAGTPSGTVFVWQTWTGRMLKSWTCHFGAVTALAVTADSGMLFTAGEDASVKAFFLPTLWDQVVPSPALLVTGHAKSITSLSLNELTGRLVVSSADPLVKIYDVSIELKQSKSSKSSIAEIFTFTPVSAPTHVCGTHDGVRVFVGCDDGSVWETDGGSKQIAQLKSSISGFALSIDNSRLIVACEVEGVKILDTATGVVMHSVIGPQQQLKGALGLVMIRKPIYIPETKIRVAGYTYTDPNRLVSAIDSYLQFRPLQRTLTAASSIEKIPLVFTFEKAEKLKIKPNHAISVDSTTVEKIESGAIPSDPMAKLQLEVAKQRELARAWSVSFANLHARVRITNPEIELFVEVPKAEHELLESGKKKQRNR
jgi:WD40 repeat protein